MAKLKVNLIIYYKYDAGRTNIMGGHLMGRKIKKIVFHPMNFEQYLDFYQSYVMKKETDKEDNVENEFKGLLDNEIEKIKRGEK